MTERRARTLKATGLSRLQISLDGLCAAHERVRGPGAYAKALIAIKRGVDAGLRTHICFTAMRSNAHMLGEMIELAVGLGVDGFNLSQFVPTGRGAVSEALQPSVAKLVLQTWLEAKARYPDLHLTAHSSGLAALAPEKEHCRGGCQAGISIGCIAPEGDVTPCVMLPLSLGNLKERRLEEIWASSPIIQQLKSRHVGGACARCPHKVECGGCRAAAWALTGDMMAGDPTCWMADSQGALTGEGSCPTSSSIPRVSAAT